MRGGKLRIDGEGAPIGVERLVHPVEFEERITEVEGGLGEPRPGIERATSRLYRFDEATKLPECPGKAAPGFRVVFIEAARLIKALVRLLISA